MRLIFMGTPHFAVPSLRALAANPLLDVVEVWTMPPRRAKRGMKVTPSPIQIAAERLNLAVYTPHDLDEAATCAELIGRVQRSRAQAAMVVAYGALLRSPILEAFARGCWNLHASLLPRWRGAAPIARAIEAGDTRSGVCVMRMEARLDTGAIWRCAEQPIHQTTTAGELHDALARQGASLLNAAATKLASDGALATQAQDASSATYANKVTSADAKLDFTAHGTALLRKIHAFCPYPAAWCYLRSGGGKSIRLRINGARFMRQEAQAGGVAAGSIRCDGHETMPIMIRCADGWIMPHRLQREGKKWQPAHDFRLGFVDLHNWKVE